MALFEQLTIPPHHHRLAPYYTHHHHHHLSAAVDESSSPSAISRPSPLAQAFPPCAGDRSDGKLQSIDKYDSAAASSMEERKKSALLYSTAMHEVAAPDPAAANIYREVEFEKASAAEGDGDRKMQMEIGPRQVIAEMGQQKFWKARRTILQQQKTLSLQVFELHRVTKVQKLLAMAVDESGRQALDVEDMEGRSRRSNSDDDDDDEDEDDGDQQSKENDSCLQPHNPNPIIHCLAYDHHKPLLHHAHAYAPPHNIVPGFIAPFLFIPSWPLYYYYYYYYYYYSSGDPSQLLQGTPYPNT